MRDDQPKTDSPFSPIEPDRVVLENGEAIAFYDRYPISPGHTLVVAKQVTTSLYDLPEDVQAALWRAVRETRAILKERHGADAFNIGVNDGAAAGQTVPHAHIHIIPRYAGDTADPRGGIRWIFSEKANYWKEQTSDP